MAVVKVVKHPDSQVMIHPSDLGPYKYFTFTLRSVWTRCSDAKYLCHNLAASQRAEGAGTILMWHDCGDDLWFDPSLTFIRQSYTE